MTRIVKAKVTTTPTSLWVRDPNWLTLPSVAGLQKIAGLFAVTGESDYVALAATTSTGNYQVDWGDGTVETFATV